MVIAPLVELKIGAERDGVAARQRDVAADGGGGAGDIESTVEVSKVDVAVAGRRSDVERTRVAHDVDISRAGRRGGVKRARVARDVDVAGAGRRRGEVERACVVRDANVAVGGRCRRCSGAVVFVKKDAATPRRQTEGSRTGQNGVTARADCIQAFKVIVPVGLIILALAAAVMFATPFTVALPLKVNEFPMARVSLA